MENITRKMTQPLTHGGQLQTIAKAYNIPLDEWIDCSTGISPFSYPLTDIPLDYWTKLPQTNNKLLQAAQQYYKTEYCFACNGSQAIIEKLPTYWQAKNEKSTTVYLPTVGYKEHQKSWLMAGFHAEFYQEKLPENLIENSVVVIINPNNPSGQLYSKEVLLNFYQQVKAVNGLLIIDEAFMDIIQPSQSLSSNISDDLIIFRSFGKFFGLAGIRIGFVCCSKYWFDHFTLSFSPWHINGPAQFIATQALLDDKWHSQHHKKLVKQAARLHTLLVQFFPSNCINSTLFITVYMNNAEDTYQQLCSHGVYTRLTDEKNSLRFSILEDKDLTKLASILPLISQ